MINNFVSAKKHVALTTGETIKSLRELKTWTQEELSKHSGINSKNISLLENGIIQIGRKRAIRIAQAFNIHPGIIMFPEYEMNLLKEV